MNLPTVGNIGNGQVVHLEDHAMSIDRVIGQVRLIQDVMGRVMKKDEHYGIIPGCGPKPTLLKPGAEKLSMTFRLVPEYEIKKSDLGNGHREYEVICKLIHSPTGGFFGSGVGSCSTMETKYRYRKAEQKCPKCGKETIIKGKKEYGGGWVCFKKKGGCGVKFKDGDPSIENQEMGRIEHDNPADYYNTVMKMAKKRAHVDAILTATAASDIFTQDIEDYADVPAFQPQESVHQSIDIKAEFEKKAIKENLPLAHLEQFLEKMAKETNSEIYIIKDRALKNWKGFSDAFKQWHESELNQMAPGPCPDREDEIMTVLYCNETCKKKDGCPVWEDEK